MKQLFPITESDVLLSRYYVESVRHKYVLYVVQTWNSKNKCCSGVLIIYLLVVGVVSYIHPENKATRYKWGGGKIELYFYHHQFCVELCEHINV